MRIYYINLERRPDRNAQFLKLNQSLADFQRIDAVDGSKLDNPSLIQQGIISEPLQHCSMGGIGNALTHRGLWEQCVASDETMHIAEDDAVFNSCFVEQATSVIDRLPADWDYIQWGWNFDSILHVDIIPGVKQSVMRFDPAQLRDRVVDFQMAQYDAAPYRMFGAFGLVCYSIRPRGAQNLLRRCFPLTNEPVPIPGLGCFLHNISLDATMNRHFADISAYASFPPLVWTENDRGVSDVMSHRPQ